MAAATRAERIDPVLAQAQVFSLAFPPQDPRAACVSTAPRSGARAACSARAAAGCLRARAAYVRL